MGVRRIFFPGDKSGELYFIHSNLRKQLKIFAKNVIGKCQFQNPGESSRPLNARFASLNIANNSKVTHSKLCSYSQNKQGIHQIKSPQL